MFNTEEILARLAAGESIEAIANEAADALNAAKAAYDKKVAEAAATKAAVEAARKAAEKEKARLEAERKAKEELKLRKREAAEDIAYSFFNFMETFHPGIFSDDEIDEFMKPDSMDNFADMLSTSITEIDKLMNELGLKGDGEIRATATKMNNDPMQFNVTINGDKASAQEQKDIEDAITKFLKENNLF